MAEEASKDGWKANPRATAVLVILWTRFSDKRENGMLPPKYWNLIFTSVQKAYEGDKTWCTEHKMRKNIGDLLRGGGSMGWGKEAERLDKIAFDKFQTIRSGYKQKGQKKELESSNSPFQSLNPAYGSRNFSPNDQQTFASGLTIANDDAIASTTTYSAKDNGRKRKAAEHVGENSAKSGNRIISDSRFANHDYLSRDGNTHRAASYRPELYPHSGFPMTSDTVRPSAGFNLPSSTLRSNLPDYNHKPSKADSDDRGTDEIVEDLYTKSNSGHYPASVSSFHDRNMAGFQRKYLADPLSLPKNQPTFAMSAPLQQTAKMQTSSSTRRSSQLPHKVAERTAREFANSNVSRDTNNLKIQQLELENTRLQRENKRLRAELYHRNLHSQPNQTELKSFAPSYQAMETIGDAAQTTRTHIPPGEQTWGGKSTERNVNGDEGGVDWSGIDQIVDSEDAFNDGPPRTLAERYGLDF